MDAAHATPGVLALAADPERLAALEEANVLLEQIQKVSEAGAGRCKRCLAGCWFFGGGGGY